VKKYDLIFENEWKNDFFGVRPIFSPQKNFTSFQKVSSDKFL
jgi:hypothetical protein